MLNQQKVQFFNSQSSFGSQSNLSSSRYFDLTNQIAQQTQALFLTLKKQLLPQQNLTNRDKIQYLYNRAKIISRDTIPDHLQYLNKIQSPQQSLQICKDSAKRLENFIKDYQNYQIGWVLHKQLYNLYGRSTQNNVFFKKQNGPVYNGQAHPMMQPDVQSIQDARSNRQKIIQEYKFTTRTGMNQSRTISDKQVMQLQQQIAIMKRRQNQLKKQFDYFLTAQKLNSQKRINALLKSLNQKHLNAYSVQLQQNYKNQTIRLGQEVTRLLKDKQQLMNQNNNLQKTIQDLNYTNNSLKDELAGYKKLQISRMDQQDFMNQSFQSQQNNTDDSKNLKKLHTQIKKLAAQRDLLRSQLIRERQNLQKQKKLSQSYQAKQIIRLKTYLETRNKQNQQLHRQLDKSRVQLIQLKQQNKNLNRNVSTLKGNTQELRKNIQSMEMSSTKNDQNNNFLKANNFIPFNKDSRALQNSLFKMISFKQLQGEGIQGYPYYQIFQKQFKIRFRRACLKSKELLYKFNGIELGVITQYIEPNSIHVLVHLTNSSDKDINEIHIKAINPNENKIECSIQKIDKLLPTQQVKIPVSCIIKNYPIGPVVFSLDYSLDIKYDVRLLLPVHIFKCVTIDQREQVLYKPKRVTIKTQKKICKDINTLKSYLNCQNLDQIRVKISHEHSDSIMYLDINEHYKQEIVLEYEHVKGVENFTEYFIKTFKALLQKHN